MPHFLMLFYFTLEDSATFQTLFILHCKTVSHFTTLFTLHYQNVPHFSILFTLHFQTVPHFTTLFYSTLPDRATLYNIVLLYTKRNCHMLQYYFFSTLPDSATLNSTVLLYITRQCHTLQHLFYCTLKDSATLYNNGLFFTTRQWHTLQHCFTLSYRVNRASEVQSSIWKSYSLVEYCIVLKTLVTMYAKCQKIWLPDFYAFHLPLKTENCNTIILGIKECTPKGLH